MKPRRQDSLTGSRAYVDTTVLTDALLKRGAKEKAAKKSLSSYAETILPVYAIKEFKAGPLNYWIWLHNKLAMTKSLAGTIGALGELASFQKNRVATAQAALSSVMQAFTTTPLTDEEAADLYRSAVYRIVISSWSKRRKVTTRVTDELTCYTEADPVLVKRTGLLENPGMKCKLHGTEECCLAAALKKRKSDLLYLLEAIKGLSRREDVNRRAVLHKLSNTPKRSMDANDCRKLGDAYFALHSPSNAVILTTNTKDHEPLAKALNKVVAAP